MTKRKKVLLSGAVAAGALSLLSGMAEPQDPGFPLKISRDGRCFEDSQGKPFLVLGDSAWSLIAQLTLEETGHYLARRRAQGFNAILVNLLEHRFSNDPPRNTDGEAPFKTPGDFSTPNEAYFAHADSVIDLARRSGMLVFLVPVYLGWEGGVDGWYQEIRRAGPEALRRFGRFVGERYGKQPNIVWVLGGDYTPPVPYRWSVDALAEGIREAGARQLMTAHCGQSSPAEAFEDQAWLDFNNVYSYESHLYRLALAEYDRRPVKPFILIEGLYEGEHDASPEIIRRQAYQSILAGAAGHFYGNNPVWNFSAPVKVFPNDQDWAEALDSRGARDMAILHRLFRDLRGACLSPDVTRRFLTVNKGGSWPGRGPSLAAAKADHLLIAYVSAPRTVVLSLNMEIIEPPVQAFWYDPASGTKVPIPLSELPQRGRKRIGPPGDNDAGDGDWVLVLDSREKEGMTSWAR